MRPTGPWMHYRIIAGYSRPTDRENIGSVHGRGILVMKALMDEVRFEEGGAVIYMRKSAGDAPNLLAKDARGELGEVVRSGFEVCGNVARTGDQPWRAVSEFEKHTSLRSRPPKLRYLRARVICPKW